MRRRWRGECAALAIAAALLAPHPALAVAPDEDVRAVPQPVATVTADDLNRIPTDPAMRAILNLHNNLRTAVGAPPLRWNAQLARNAADYARVMTDTGQLVHSPRAGREQERENLSLGLRGVTSALGMAEIWAREQRLFRPGLFPDVCTGDWSSCAHYTQMIWPTTTDVGCGFHSGARFDALVCRYTPPGNRDGRPVIPIKGKANEPVK